MESLEQGSLLEFNENQLYEVRKIHNYNDLNRLKQDIDLFEDWIAKQNHFRVRKFDRDYLERFLIYNKGSIERAKRHFENLCTYRNSMPEFLQNFDVKNEFYPVKSSVQLVFMPKPTKDNYRVVIVNMFGNHEKMDIAGYYKYVVACVEYLYYHDYCHGFEAIIDTRDMPYGFIPKLNPIVISRAISLISETMGQRVKAVHFLSGAKFFDTIVSMFKQGMSPKMASRVKIHDSIESLVQAIDKKECLPSDYGGNQKSLKELDELLFKELCTDEHIARLKFAESASTDESCRVEGKFNEEYLGTQGSFKTMSID